MYNKEIEFISDARGYRRFIDHNHPLAHADGTVYYHRHVASLKLGRWLRSGEHVHHIDGNRENNSPDNLIVLSNSEHQKMHKKTKRIALHCERCDKVFFVSSRRKYTAKYCSRKCADLDKRKFSIGKEELEKLVWKVPTEKIGEMFGVSGGAIAKRCKLLGIEKPSRGYWMKNKPI